MTDIQTMTALAIYDMADELAKLEVRIRAIAGDLCNSDDCIVGQANGTMTHISLACSYAQNLANAVRKVRNK